MYYNKKHKEKVNNRGDGYTYIGSYKCKEITIDNKNKKRNYNYIRVKCPYCESEYDITLENFKKGAKCAKCCNSYENSFAYYIQVELKEPLNKYWDWNKNLVNPYYIGGQSHKKVWIKCTKTDYHGSYKISLDKFYLGRRCPYCSSHKIHKLDSFGQWAVDNVDKDFMNKYWDWEKNTVDPYCVASQSHKKVYIKCDKTDYHGCYLTSPSKFYNGKRCPYCVNRKIHPKDSFGQYLIDKFGEGAIEKYWSNKNTISPFEIAPQSAKKIWLLCQEKDYHNDKGGYESTPNRFINQGGRCSYCNPSASHKVHPKDSFGALYPEKAKYWSKNNKLTPYEITSRSGQKYKFICEKCGKEFERDLQHLNRKDIGVICRECNSSLLEQSTKEILDKYNIEYFREYTYDNLMGVGDGLLRFDFYLSQYNTLIECQGEQHKRWIEGWQTKKDFEDLQIHDKRKKEYCKKNNIKLIEIWYNEVKEIENIFKKELKINDEKCIDKSTLDDTNID